MAEFTGERVIPDQVDPDLLNEHLARYAFAARLSRGKRVLDAGCGAGYGSAELAKTDSFTVGIDNSAEAIEYARNHYRLPSLHFQLASCSSLPFAAASFDLVVAFEVIEHLAKWRDFLLEARRVLAPNGQCIVSTPNKLYYAEARGSAGPNPYHVHEFDFEQFQQELADVFPHILMYVENHAEGVVFEPTEPNPKVEVRVDTAEVAPAESHFFVALCGLRPHTGNPVFVYMPRAGNVLRERERHIDLLQQEVRTKDEWLATLNERHQSLVEMFRKQQDEIAELNRWGEGLNRRIIQLQQELDTQHQDCEGKIRELEQENQSKTQWALDTEARLSKEVEAKARELAQCVDLLHAAESTMEERTNWALDLQRQLTQIEAQLSSVKASRWVKLGNRVGLGPDLPMS